MGTNQDDYRISFFKPTTPIARYNRNLVIWLVCIWATAIFGFQILLKIVEKPTPEPVYLQYQQVWDNISGTKSSYEDKQIFAQTCLSVLGKNFITSSERIALDNGLTWAISELYPPNEKAGFIEMIKSFETKKASVTNISDPHFVEMRNALNREASKYLGLSTNDARNILIANELISSSFESITTEHKTMLPDIMSKYLIHNQSFLTDFTLFKFPFHYFYTAVFLLVLFVGLCLLYCIRIDRRNVILGIED